MLLWCIVRMVYLIQKQNITLRETHEDLSDIQEPKILEMFELFWKKYDIIFHLLPTIWPNLPETKPHITVVCAKIRLFALFEAHYTKRNPWGEIFISADKTAVSIDKILPIYVPFMGNMTFVMNSWNSLT